VVTRVKRSDLDTRDVVTAVQQHQFRAFEALAEQYPEKIVQAAFSRDVRSGYLDYGVALERPWLTPAGEQLLASPSCST
jgi:hypothetical protein